MPTKLLDSQAGRGELQKTYKFGGGKNEIRATDDETSSYSYIINGGGGDDMIFGSDFDGLGVFDPTADPRTQNGDLLIGGMGSDYIVGGGGDDWIYGGNEDGSDGGKGKDPVVSNTLVGDTSFGSVIAGDTVTFGSDHIFGGDGVGNVIYGDNEGFLSLGAGANFTGGDDVLSGGNGLGGESVHNTIIGDTQSIATAAGNGASFTGGDDTLTGGSGVNVINTMTGDVGSAGGLGAGFQGGNDTLISGTFAVDNMTGDWASGATGGEVGGEDTFVFDDDNGRDTITDFRSTDDDGDDGNGVGDTINLAATALVWTDLDDNIIGDVKGDGVLDNSDSHVTVTGTTMVIDLGAANDDGTSGVNTLTLFNVTSLTADDFDFDNVIDPDALIV